MRISQPVCRQPLEVEIRSGGKDRPGTDGSAMTDSSSVPSQVLQVYRTDLELEWVQRGTQRPCSL